MQASVQREEALQLLKVEHEAVDALIKALNDEEMLRPDTIEYGLYAGQECAFKDLLAHLVTYEVHALEALESWKRGEPHWIIETMNDPGRARDLHFGGIAQRADHSLAAVIDEYRGTAARLEAAIAALSDAEWREMAPFPTDEPTDLGGMLEVILVAPPRPMYRHLPVHIPDSAGYIRKLRRATPA